MISTFESLTSAVLNELQTTLRSVDPERVTGLRQMILSSSRIFVTGRGRSGLYMRGFAMRLMHMGRTVYVVDETTTPAIAAGDLLLIGSGSGRTTSQVSHASRAKALGARIGLITSAESSPIGEVADALVRIDILRPKSANAEDTRSIQPMATLFEQSLALLLDLLTVQLMQELGLTAEEMFARHANLE
jgi:6-phospho-3-hexuloisomerase